MFKNFVKGAQLISRFPGAVSTAIVAYFVANADDENKQQVAMIGLTTYVVSKFIAVKTQVPIKKAYNTMFNSAADDNNSQQLIHKQSNAYMQKSMSKSHTMSIASSELEMGQQQNSNQITTKSGCTKADVPYEVLDSLFAMAIMSGMILIHGNGETGAKYAADHSDITTTDESLTHQELSYAFYGFYAHFSHWAGFTIQYHAMGFSFESSIKGGFIAAGAQWMFGSGTHWAQTEFGSGNRPAVYWMENNNIVNPGPELSLSWLQFVYAWTKGGSCLDPDQADKNNSSWHAGVVAGGIYPMIYALMHQLDNMANATYRNGFKAEVIKFAGTAIVLTATGGALIFTADQRFLAMCHDKFGLAMGSYTAFGLGGISSSMGVYFINYQEKLGKYLYKCLCYCRKQDNSQFEKTLLNEEINPKQTSKYSNQKTLLIDDDKIIYDKDGDNIDDNDKEYEYNDDMNDEIQKQKTPDITAANDVTNEDNNNDDQDEVHHTPS